jgi:hypothetical protein
LILKAIFWWNKIQKNRTHEEALHHPSPLARKLKRTEPMTTKWTKHYTTPSHWSEKLKESNPQPSTAPPLSTGQKTQKDRTHDQQALHHPSPLARKLKRIELTIKHYSHHPSPLARKLKRIEPTTKHYTTPPHWSENSKERNPRPSTTPPFSTGQKTQKDRTHNQALHHPSLLARKLKRTEPTDQAALHHPSPLGRKLKRIEPTTKHYTTPPYWPENSKESIYTTTARKTI